MWISSRVPPNPYTIRNLIPPNPCKNIHTYSYFGLQVLLMQAIKSSSPYRNFEYALKSKDVKRQYPVMFSRFLNFIGSQGDSLEEKCASFYEFASLIDNRRMLDI